MVLMVDMLQPPVTYYEVFTALYATLQTHYVDREVFFTP